MSDFFQNAHNFTLSVGSLYDVSRDITQHGAHRAFVVDMNGIYGHNSMVQENWSNFVGPSFDGETRGESRTHRDNWRANRSQSSNNSWPGGRTPQGYDETQGNMPPPPYSAESASRRPPTQAGTAGEHCHPLAAAGMFNGASNFSLVAGRINHAGGSITMVDCTTTVEIHNAPYRFHLGGAPPAIWSTTTSSSGHPSAGRNDFSVVNEDIPHQNTPDCCTSFDESDVEETMSDDEWLTSEEEEDGFSSDDEFDISGPTQLHRSRQRRNSI